MSIGRFDIGELLVSPDCIVRNEMGRFVSEAEAGESSAVDEMLDMLEGLAIAFAPKKTGRLAGTIHSLKTGATSGVVVAGEGIDYAAAQDKGASAHDIDSHSGGPLANREEDFFAKSGHVHHPGNPATRFLENAAKVVATSAATIVANHLPG